MKNRNINERKGYKLEFVYMYMEELLILKKEYDKVKIEQFITNVAKKLLPEAFIIITKANVIRLNGVHF